eukprot:7308009-Pyramimonas_sp.AAC.1
MTPGRARRLLEQIASPACQARSHAIMDHFVGDIAAICFMHLAAMRRRAEKGGTVLTSLKGAATKQSL